LPGKVNTGGEALLAFNPLLWGMRNWGEAELKLPEGYENVPGVGERKAVESEVIKIRKDERDKIEGAKIGFTCALPPLGYKVYKLTLLPCHCEPKAWQSGSGMKVAGESMETPFYKITVNKETGIIEVSDKKGKLLVRGNEIFVDDEIGDLYYHRSRFADLIKSESGEGLKYGSSVYIRLFRSVYGLSADGVAGPLVPTPDALELRPYLFEYALQPHEGDWRQAKMYKQAQDFHYLPYCIQTNSQGELPEEFSFLKLSPDNLVLSALKKAEDGDEVILRFFETIGEATVAELELFRVIKRAAVVDLLERELYGLKVERNKLRLEVKPFEIVTLKLLP